MEEAADSEVVVVDSEDEEVDDKSARREYEISFCTQIDLKTVSSTLNFLINLRIF